MLRFLRHITLPLMIPALARTQSAVTTDILWETLKSVVRTRSNICVVSEISPICRGIYETTAEVGNQLEQRDSL